jgi:class 3 adenylate cyclase
VGDEPLGDDATAAPGPSPTAAARPGAPATPPAPETELRTFLIADIRGYTAYTEEHGDEAASALVGRFAALIREVVEHRGGFLLELRGDEALAVFTSSRQALKAANEIQRRQEIDALPLGIGIGLDAGEAIPTEGGFRGSALNLAARLCAQAGPGQIIASEAVIHLAARVDGLAYIDARTVRLKGLDEPVRAVTVVPEAHARKRGRRPASGAPRIDRRAGLAIGGVGLATVLVGALAWAGPLGGLGPGAGSPTPSGASPPSPTPTPSVAPGAIGIGADDLPAAAFLDPATGDVRELLDEPRGAADAIFADGDFWVLDNQPRAIHQVDPDTGTSARPIAIGFEVSTFTVGDGKLFVAEPFGLIHVFDLASRREVGEPFQFGGFIAGGVSVEEPTPIWDLAYGGGSLWVAGGWFGDLTEMDPSTGDVRSATSIQASGLLGLVDGVAFADDVAWASSSLSGRIIAVDPADATIRQDTTLASGIGPIAAGGGFGWVADGAAGTVTRIDALGATTSYSVGTNIAALGYDAVADVLWAASFDGGVASIDALTGQVKQQYLGHSATAVAADDGRVLAGMTRSPAEIVAAIPGSVLRVASADDFVTDPGAVPPWFTIQPLQGQVIDLICAPLLTRRVEPGPDGELLEPVVAAAMPELSADGRTYTFTIRPGFAFAPPSDEAVTAETFKASIERAVRLNELESSFQLLDIVGFFDFRDRRSDEISGITVEGDRLSFRLGAPSPTFLERLALPWSCPVPIGTPPVAPGLDDPPIPASGPYRISQQSPGEVVVMERNPNHPAGNAAGFDAIAFFTERNLGRAIGRWERGEVDVVSGRGPELRVGSRTDQLWGPTSEAAAAGDQRLWPRSRRGVDSLAVNPGSQALSDPDVRRAVSLALDRPALSVYWGVSTDEVMPLSMPGLPEADRGPLDGPLADEARALLAGRTPGLVIAWPPASSCAECGAVGDALERQLEAVGFVVTFEFADDPLLFANYLDSGIDMAASYVESESSDPAWWMTLLLTESQTSGGDFGFPEAGFPIDWVPDDIAAERDRLDELAGKERYDAAIALADRVADELLLIPYADETWPQLISDTVGCQRFRAGSPWLDLAAACPG